MSIKFSAYEISFIALFEDMTGAHVKDCVIDSEHDRVIFVVKNGDMGLAIGKRGKAIARVQKSVDKSVEVVEMDDDPVKFVKNALTPAKLKSIKVTENQSGKKIAIVVVDSSNKRVAIGKKGMNIERAKMLAKRQHDIEDIILK